jgi:DNA repair exonuclease SbcCD nuclease subunit
MSELRFISSSDEHLADQSPGFRKDNYRDAVLEKLSWQGRMAERFGASALLRGGDFWHIKEANKTTMATVVKSIALHRQYPCPTFAMAGNHDMSKNDPTSVDRQPLGVLLKSGVFRELRDEIFTSGTMKVRVVGVEYTTDLADERLREIVTKKDDTYTIAFVHALAAMAPEERIQSFFGERIFDYRDLVFDGCPDVYIFGHYHKDQGIIDHLGVKFVNLGAISRGALTFENLERKPKVALLICNSQGISIEEHIIPHADAADVFDLERKKKLENVRKDMDEFIAQFRADSVTTSGNDVRDRLLKFQNSLEYPDDLKGTLTEVMEASEAGLVDE